MNTNIDIQGIPISGMTRETNPAGVDVPGTKSGRNVKVSLDLLATKDEVKNIESNRKGYFPTDTELETAYPDPRTGWYAYVGSTGTIWVEDDGSWADSDEPIPGDVDLSGIATKSEIMEIVTSDRFYSPDANAYRVFDLVAGTDNVIGDKLVIASCRKISSEATEILIRDITKEATFIFTGTVTKGIEKITLEKSISNIHHYIVGLVNWDYETEKTWENSNLIQTDDPRQFTLTGTAYTNTLKSLLSMYRNMDWKIKNVTATNVDSMIQSGEIEWSDGSSGSVEYKGYNNNILEYATVEATHKGQKLIYSFSFDAFGTIISSNFNFGF